MKCLELENYSGAPHAVKRLAALARVFMELRLPVEVACLATRADR